MDPEQKKNRDPVLIETPEDMREIQCALRGVHSIGLVPTMGALHIGHISLIERSVSENDKTVVSIFVNPIQFDDKKDLDTYPKSFDNDRSLCEKAGVDYIFMPSPAIMYPAGFSTYVEPEDHADVLCGASRPGHFRGVLTVVNKLFNIVAPDRVYFGEKDAQQLFLIRKMVSDLNMPVKIIPCPTVREKDGLAVSSRNTNLSSEERSAASCLAIALDSTQVMLKTADATGTALQPETAENIKAEMKEIIISEPLAEFEYAEVLDADTFLDVTDKTKNILLALAASFGNTRLIDNITYALKAH